jgi:hypothetical protein
MRENGKPLILGRKERREEESSKLTILFAFSIIHSHVAFKHFLVSEFFRRTLSKETFLEAFSPVIRVVSDLNTLAFMENAE